MVNAGAIIVVSLLMNLSEVDMSLSEKFDWVLNYFKVSPFRPYLMRRTALAFDQSNRVCACARFFVLAYTFLTLSLSLCVCFHPRFLLFSVLHANVHQGRKTTKKERRRNSQRGSLAADWRPDRKGVGGGFGQRGGRDLKKTNQQRKSNQNKPNPPVESKTREPMRLLVLCHRLRETAQSVDQCRSAGDDQLAAVAGPTRIDHRRQI